MRAFPPAILTFALVSTQAWAVPLLLNYQGRVAVNEVNFTGTGQFKFALISASSGDTIWSNDATSKAGSEPISAVSIPVTKGLYAIKLGDNSLANMAVLSPTTFNSSSLNLRIWFNDGVNGFKQLSPDQQLTSVAYSMIANTVPDNAITSNKIAAGAVKSSEIANNAITSTKIAAGAVSSSQLADGSITADHIAPGVIDALIPNAPKSGITPITSAETDLVRAPFVVTFAEPFSTTPVVSASLIFATPDFPGGMSVQIASVSPTGFTGTVAPLPTAIRGIDGSRGNVTTGNTGDVGEYAQGVTASGKASVFYYTAEDNSGQGTSGDKQLIKHASSNDYGTSWSRTAGEFELLTSSPYISAAEVDGVAAMTFQDGANGLRFLRLLNNNFISESSVVDIDSQIGDPTLGRYSSLQIVNGMPAVSYRDSGTGVKYARGTAANGDTWGAPLVIDSDPNTGYGTSLQVADGKPIVAYLGGASYNELKVVRAMDADGSAWGTPQTLITTSPLTFSSMTIVDGKPAVVFRIGQNLAYMRALDAAGTTWGAPIEFDSTIYGSPSAASMKIVNGRPAISYNGSGRLRYLSAVDASGSAWYAPVTLDQDGDGGDFNCLFHAGPNPIVAYHDQSTPAMKVAQLPALPPFSVSWIAVEP